MSEGKGQVQQVPSVPLVERSGGGIGGALFALLDDIMAGKAVSTQKVSAVCKIASAYGHLVRVTIAQERHRATGAAGLVINHEDKPTNGGEKTAAE